MARICYILRQTNTRRVYLWYTIGYTGVRPAQSLAIKIAATFAKTAFAV